MSPQTASRRAPLKRYNTKTKQKLKINIPVSVCTFIFQASKNIHAKSSGKQPGEIK